MRSPTPATRTTLARTGPATRAGRLRALAAAGTAAAVLGTGLATAQVAAASGTPRAAVAADAALAVAAPVGTAAETPAEAAVLEARTLVTAAVAQAQAVTVARAQEARLRKAVVRLARQQLGDSYVRGASGPGAFDCSGLVRYVMQKVTGRTLPHNSRAQYSVVKKIKRSEARPGDLVFFFRNGARHVGIYIGDGKMIDARNPRDDVRVSPIGSSWWGRSYSGMGRVIKAV